ncbi:MAG TPA: NAD(P)-dependent oxidoreductase [Candidatus Nanoarchaeia archaeon]|nr:NAD(P)-dependent oxidoreductase [Candidatus Nanoarchaeia archaeon]
MASILITGGSGFVGQHLIQCLIQEGQEVASLSRMDLDLAKYNPIKTALTKDRDILIHLASSVNINDMLKNPRETIANNIDSTLNLLEDIRLNNPSCLLVFLSSEKVYGNTTGNFTDISIDEENSTIPVDPYGSSKLISELLIKSYQSNYNLNYIILRAGNIFGPGQKPDLFIPSIITKIIEHPEKVTLGSLEAYRNFIYVEDLIKAIASCLKKTEDSPEARSKVLNQTFHLSAYNLKIAEVLKEIITLAGSAGINPIIVQDKGLFRASETQAQRYFLSCEKAHRLLNWQPQYQFSEAIKNTFDSYLKKNRNLTSSNR